jgi:transcriptional antiterminator NusG
VPLEAREVELIMKRMYSPEPKVIIGLRVGEMIRITSGPFAEFMGAIDSVDEDKGKIRVLVSFFGRETPVELDFLQVEKA